MRRRRGHTCRGEEAHEEREAWKEGVVLLVFVATLSDAHEEDGIPNYKALQGTADGARPGATLVFDCGGGRGEGWKRKVRFCCEGFWRIAARISMFLPEDRCALSAEELKRGNNRHHLKVK